MPWKTPEVRSVSAAVVGNPSVPSGVEIGDLLLVCASSKPDETANTASGWLDAPGSPFSDVTNDQRLVILYKIATGSDTVSLANAASRAFMMAIKFNTFNPLDPFGASATQAETTSNTSVTFAGLTTESADSLILYVHGGNRDGDNGTTLYSSWTAPNSETITERADFASSSGTGGYIGAATFVRASSGAMGTGSVTLFANNGDVAITLEIIGADAIYPGVATGTAVASGAEFINNQTIGGQAVIGTANSKTASTTLTLTTNQYALAGDIIVVMTAWDNNNASTITGPDNDTWTVTDSASNTYDFIAGAEDIGVNGRCAAGILVSYLTNPLPAGSTMTITYNSTRTAKAALAYRIVARTANPISGYRLCLLQHEHIRAADPGSEALYFTGLDGVEKIILHALAAEGPNTDVYTWDSDYLYLPGDGTTGSTDDTNIHIRGGIRIGDTSLTDDTISITSDTADRDYTHLYAILYLIPANEQAVSKYPRIFDNTGFQFKEYAGGTVVAGVANELRAALTQLCPVKGIPVGSLAVVLASYGNKNVSTVTGPGDEDLTITDISGNTWTKQAGAQVAVGGENGTWAAIITSLITTEIPKGGWIKATIGTGARLTNRGLAVYTFAIEDNSFLTRQDRTHAHTAAADPASLSLSNLPYRKYLLLHCVAAEAAPSDTYTWDSDYTQFTSIGHDGGGSTNSNTLLGSYRIAELTSDTIDITSITGDRDYTQLLAALYTKAIPRIDITLGG